MITGQTVEYDEPCDGTCRLAGHDETKPRKPCWDVMLSGWPDSLTACASCRTRILRLELDLTRDCALCGGPIQEHAPNGRINGYRGCFCRGRCRVAERETNGEYYCTRAPEHKGPCAALPKLG